MSPDPCTAGVAHWRALHSYVVGGILHQAPDTARAIIAIFGGLTIEDFLDALDNGFARIRSTIEDDRLVYLVEVASDQGWVVLVRPPAVALGIEDNDEIRDLEVGFHLDRLLYDLREAGEQ